MSEYSTARVIEACAEDVWRILGDLDNQDLVKGFCRAIRVTGEGVGAVRTYELFDEQGGGTVSERIEQFDPQARYYSYRLFDIGPLPVADYVGCLRLSAAGPTRCVLTYHAQFLPVGDAPESLGLEMARQNITFVAKRLHELCSKQPAADAQIG